MTAEHCPSPRQVTVLYTGGTIGMQAGANGLAPAAGFEARMSQYLSEAGLRAGVEIPVWRFRELLPLIDSANMSPMHWQQMRHEILSAVADGAEAVLVLHGTDTLAYSAAALSFQLLGLPAPVLFTGSMLPAGVADSDAWENLSGALLALQLGVAPGVQLYFHGELLAPTRCAKIRSFGRHPFATLQRARSGPHLSEIPTALDYRQPLSLAKVVVLPLFPGVSGEHIDRLLGDDTQGLVLECFGSGTGPSDHPGFLEALRKAHERGVSLLAITQCQQGGVELDIYEAGSRLRQVGVVSGAGMTREAALGKLHALIGAGLAPAEIDRLLEIDLCGELADPL